MKLFKNTILSLIMGLTSTLVVAKDTNAITEKTTISKAMNEQKNTAQKNIKGIKKVIATKDAKIAKIEKKVKANKDAKIAKIEKKVKANKDAKIAKIEKKVKANKDAKIAKIEKKVKATKDAKFAKIEKQAKLAQLDKSLKTININTASAKELTLSLKGIGLKKAQAIVAYRNKFGKFKSAKDLLQVKGIGQTILKNNINSILF